MNGCTGQHVAQKFGEGSCSTSGNPSAPIDSSMRESRVRLRIPTNPPFCSAGKRRVNPKDCVPLFRLIPPGCSGRIGA